MMMTSNQKQLMTEIRDIFENDEKPINHWINMPMPVLGNRLVSDGIKRSKGQQ